jgi:hypothetical protein
MPSGKKDIYGTKSKRLADPKDIRAEMGAERNAAAAAKYVKPKPDMRDGTTNPSGGRPAVKMPAKAAPAKMLKPVQKPVQVTRTTTAYRPTPMGKKK